MPRYEYRALTVECPYDTGRDGWKARKPGEKSARFYEVTDSGRSEPLLLTDEVGDDYGAFRKRPNAAFVDYLNAVGNEDWKLVSYTRDVYATVRPSYDWPQGAYLFMREVE